MGKTLAIEGRPTRFLLNDPLQGVGSANFVSPLARDVGSYPTGDLPIKKFGEREALGRPVWEDLL